VVADSIMPDAIDGISGDEFANTIDRGIGQNAQVLTLFIIYS
jgi:hypothetical protein